MEKDNRHELNFPRRRDTKEVSFSEPIALRLFRVYFIFCHHHDFGDLIERRGGAYRPRSIRANSPVPRSGYAYPWRWKNTNPELGKYLLSVRKQLLPALANKPCKVNLDSNPSVTVISPNGFNMYSILQDLKKYNSVIYVTKWEAQQIDLCTKLGGLFQNDEKQECPELFNYANRFDHSKACELAIQILLFLKVCATNVTKELKSYLDRLKKDNMDFSRISKHKEIGILIEKVCSSSSLNDIYSLIKIFNEKNSFKIYRKELYFEMLRSIKYAIEHNNTIYDSANHIRKDVHLQRHYTQFKYLSSRTLLSKGLEFDCVIIDMQNKLSAKDFYVAMTRAMKKIYVISSSKQILFN